MKFKILGLGKAKDKPLVNPLERAIKDYPIVASLMRRKACKLCGKVLTRCRHRRNSRRSKFIGLMGVRTQPAHKRESAA